MTENNSNKDNPNNLEKDNDGNSGKDALMCLDINGILCSVLHSSHNDKDYDNVVTCKSNKNIKLVPRPHLCQFIEVIRSYFDIVFYTSRTEFNAKCILETLSKNSAALRDVYDGNKNCILYH